MSLKDRISEDIKVAMKAKSWMKLLPKLVQVP
jgi:uncharacterized protein YqeY